MKTAFKITNYILRDLLKSYAIVGYIIVMMLAGWGVFLVESQPEKAVLILLQINLLAIPLLTLVFSTIYYYHSLEFISLLMVQPVERKTIINGLFSGLSISFLFGFLAGVGFPLLVHYPTDESTVFLLCGGLLIVICTAIALFVCSMTNDKARAMGIVLMLFVFFAFLFDGILLYLMYQFSDYPIETVILAITFFNPIVIARTTVIMGTEASAMLGLSGAVFSNFFGSVLGIIVSLATLILWGVFPYIFARRRFDRKDM